MEVATRLAGSRVSYAKLQTRTSNSLESASAWILPRRDPGGGRLLCSRCIRALGYVCAPGNMDPQARRANRRVGAQMGPDAPAAASRGQRQQLSRVRWKKSTSLRSRPAYVSWRKSTSVWRKTHIMVEEVAADYVFVIHMRTLPSKMLQGAPILVRTRNRLQKTKMGLLITQPK